MMRIFGSVSRDRAAERARDAAERQGLTWKEPVRAHRLFGRWYVTANAMARGGAVHATVSAKDGEVLRIGVTPR